MDIEVNYYKAYNQSKTMELGANDLFGLVQSIRDVGREKEIWTLCQFDQTIQDHIKLGQFYPGYR